MKRRARPCEKKKGRALGVKRKMKMNLPRAAQYAMRALTNAGHQAYIVGGSVRDVLLGKQPDDYDITTSALPDEVIELFRRGAEPH